MPRWRDSPQKIAFSAWRKSIDKSHGVPVMLTATALNAVEDMPSGIARENSFEYVSPVHDLYDGANCLSRVGDKAEDFIAVHLSKSGSEFSVAKVAPKIVGP